MPNTASAKKAQRATARKHIFNLRRKDALKSAIKELKKKVEAGNKKEALLLLPKVYKAVDKAAKRGIIKKNNASRKKSRLTHLIETIK